MKRNYLLSYKRPFLIPLHDYIDYELEIKVVWFWGLFKTYKTIPYRIHQHQNFKTFFEHWDRIIANGFPISL